MIPGMIPVMYNTCYGGFTLSDAAVHEYNMRKGLEVKRLTGMGMEIHRADPLMVQIVQELGAKANGLCSDIRLDHIHAKYKDHFSISEYDGCETVVIDYKGYLLSEINKILQNDFISPEVKISQITSLDWSITDPNANEDCN